MLRALLVLIVVIVSLSDSYSQRILNISDTIQWNLTQKSDWNSNSVIQYYTFENADYDRSSGLLIRWVKKIPLPGNGRIDIDVLPLKSERSDIDPTLIKDDYLSSLKTEIVEERNRFYAFISFIPLLTDVNGIKTINSFQLNINFRPQFLPKTRSNPYKNSSVLMDGDIFKLGIKESGLYRISYNYFTETLGLPGTSINVDNITLYGNRGGLLPEPIIEERIDDLEEIKYALIGSGDGRFDPGDYIIFYSEGADALKIKENDFRYEKNVYDDYNYVYLKVGGPSRTTIPKIETATINNPFESYTYYSRYEEDKTNLLGAFGSAQGSGQRWFGDVFSVTRERDYSDKFDLNGILESAEANVKMVFAGRSSSTTSIRLVIDGNSETKNISSVNTSNIEARYARVVEINSSTSLNESSTITVNYPSQGESEGWLDYLELICEKDLSYSSSPLFFSQVKSIDNSVSSYSIKGINNGIIWDVTDPFSIKEHSPITDAASISFTDEHGGSLKRYVVFNETDVNNIPEYIEKLDNQNLHGLDGADLVIVYAQPFAEAALRLLNHRKEQGLRVEAIEIGQIFNEFSGGKKDPVSIRDFSKMMYERDPNYRYLLLMGDGSYDYKNIVPGLPDHNFIPVYETNESLHPIEAFPSDDFYALLSDFEGDDLRGQLEIAVGRIPVKTAEEANAVVEKIIKYETSDEIFGDWRLRIGFTADDEDSNTHLNQAERIASNTEEKFPIYNQQKVYFDAYIQESTPGGARYPDASRAINDNIFKGQLVLNYLGHGGPRGWAQERVLKVNDILSWDNEFKMPLIITATCSFTGYDDAGLISAGEYAILKEDGGAIGLMTTVRAVYSLENERLTAAVFDTIFSNEGGFDLTMGEIIQRAKNNNWQDTTRINARKFALIGDPSMRLSLPQYHVKTTSINGISIGESTDTLGALQRVTISGIVEDRNGNKQESFNGRIFPTVFDKKSELATLRNDTRSRVTNFDLYKSILFKGAATVKNGEFSFQFIIPVDIDYSIGNGRVSYYAQQDDLSVDAGGYFNDIIIGGSTGGSIEDNTGPEIRIFMNDEKFVYGGTTHPDPILLVQLSDENGINVTGNSIGHDLVAILDENEQNSYLLNDFYESSVDDYRSGQVRFPISDLEPGRHTIKIKAWDVANNSSEEILEFIVVDENDQGIRNIYNYPNPFSTHTDFMFEHAMQGNELDVLIHIYTLSGKLIKTLNQSIITSGTRVNDIGWDGRDDFGDKLGKGIYLYKIKVKDRQLNVTEESKLQKLVIIN